MSRKLLVTTVICILAVVLFVGCTPKAAPSPTPSPTTTSPATKPSPSTAPTTSAAPTTQPATSAPAAEIVKIGNLTSVTGQYSSMGIPATKMNEYYLELINNKGGVNIGGKMYKFQLVTEDDTSTAAGGRAGIDKLVYQNKVKFTITVLSTVALAAADTVYNNKVINMTAAATPQVFTNGKYTFKSHVATTIAERTDVGLMAQNFPSVKKIAALYANDATGQDTFKYLQAGIDDVNKATPGRMELVAQETYDRSVVDFTPQLTKILAKNPDWISDCGTLSPGTAGVLLKQARELGYKGWFLSSSGGFVVDELVKTAGEKNVYNIGNYGYDPLNPPDPIVAPEYAQMYSTFQNRWGSLKILFPELIKRGAPPQSVWPQIDSLPMLINAMIEAGTVTDTDKIVSTMESWTAIPTMFGIGKWGGKQTFGVNHQIAKPYSIVLFEGNKIAKILNYSPAPLP